MKNLKKILIILFLVILQNPLLAGTLDTASCTVTLDTSNIKYFECGFTAETNPQHPFIQEENTISSRAIGGIVGVTDIVINHTKDLNIYSDTYTIWALKIGYQTVNINLTCNPLLLGGTGSNYIPYNLYLDKSAPENIAIGNPSISINDKAVTTEITNQDMDGGFLKFWVTKFMIRIPKIPPTAELGEYKGSLSMIIQSN